MLNILVNMLLLCIYTIFISAVVYGQDEIQCDRPPIGMHGLHHMCCKIPQLVNNETLEECGMSKVPDGGHGGPHGGHPPRGPPSCDSEKCLFDKFKLLTADEKLNEETFAAFLKEWGASNAGWGDAAQEATERCTGAGAGEGAGPGAREDRHTRPPMCVPIKTMFCTLKTLMKSCPAAAWEDSEDCKSLKAYLDKCAPPAPASA